MKEQFDATHLMRLMLMLEHSGKGGTCVQLYKKQQQEQS